MKSLYIFILTLNVSVFGAMVREFPTIINDTEENVTTLEDIIETTALVTEQIINLVEENVGFEEISLDENVTWNNSAGPIFSALRNFWVQASSNMLEPISENTIADQNLPVFKAIEHGLVEATTMLISQMDETFSTLPTKEIETKRAVQPSIAEKRQGDLTRESDLQSNLNSQKRRNAFDLMSNITVSCSNCYEKLQTCIQKCFIQHNCNDIQRGVRICPPAVNRMCNPFTQWNPIDECTTDSQCKSPLLCCNDGCINKCVPGVWKS